MAADIAFVSVDSKGRATLPEDVRASLGIGPGDLLLLERTERGTFELVPAALVPRDQLWFHSPRVKRRILRGEADLAAGRATRTSTPAEAQTFLDRLKKTKRRRSR